MSNHSLERGFRVLLAFASILSACAAPEPPTDAGSTGLDASADDAASADSGTLHGDDAGTAHDDAGGGACALEQTRRCYTGPAGTEGRGLCRAGVQRCLEGGQWERVCRGEILPASDELCGNLEDDTCEGDVDEGCGDCTPGEARACYPGPAGTETVGRCRAGSQTCTESRTWDPACDGAILPATDETCDGQDDDCDGRVDESLGTVRCGVGVCAREMDVCIGGMEQTCSPGTPEDESCDGDDDDCDGTTDEGLGMLRCGVGACAREVSACRDGAAQTCAPGMPSRETCNGVDDDCDGAADEGLGLLRCGTGVCEREVPACTAGAPATCAPGTPSFETCNGLDDDCNGRVDDIPPRECVTTRPGICAAGTLLCGSAGLRCVQRELARAETCNGLDDDCDGAVDEQRRAERCDGTDDDCDGRIDEDATDGMLLYADCDGDGSPAAGAETVRVCSGRPLPSPTACPSGTFTAVSGGDCNDREADAYLGQTRSFARPMSTPTRSGSVWDYDCDGVDELRWIETRTTCGPLAECRGGGWDQSTPPPCGEAARWRACAPIDGARCGATFTERTQLCL